MGYDTIQRPNSQHLIHYKFDIESNKVDLIKKTNVGERVRDIIYDKNYNRIYYVGESSGVIGFINLAYK